MPLAMPPGLLTILLAHAAAIAQPAPEPTPTPAREEATVMQADEGFVIISHRTVQQLPLLPAVALGSAVHIDPAMLAAGICQAGSVRL